ncbi:hypothetical protein NEOLEDRAFT_1136351 [Neolentinus lepideus HHB14362 ss-1]|uniref:Uncharacterized protein n=1 Tax=Neolentinus lepideus HHB14362 ss-1 TaxID=1314782 RepID=A0A165RB95_9AGAM|nr:hypothetical protein NEOLEDRAFT_1136351 [Neolentinus lepideus HHB14362 ss-1]
MRLQVLSISRFREAIVALLREGAQLWICPGLSIPAASGISATSLPLMRFSQPVAIYSGPESCSALVKLFISSIGVWIHAWVMSFSHSRRPLHSKYCRRLRPPARRHSRTQDLLRLHSRALFLHGFAMDRFNHDCPSRNTSPDIHYFAKHSGRSDRFTT